MQGCFLNGKKIIRVINMEFIDAYKYLINADIFDGKFLEGLDLMVIKVNPETNEWDCNSLLNTKTVIWFEHGPYDSKTGMWSHDTDLDCGGDTFEEAIINLAELVKKKYYTDKPYTTVDSTKLLRNKAVIF